MNILGISALFHDSAAALVHDGEIVAAAQEERFTRIKNDASFPMHALRWCLEYGKIGPRDLDAVVFHENPALKADRLVKTFLATAPHGLDAFLAAVPTWLGEKGNVERLIKGALGKSFLGQILFTEHHLSHAASAFYPSPFADAAILTVDGVGEWATTTIGVGDGNRITLLREQRYPHSLGLLYSAFTHYCGFKINDGEYKLMGLAPYGEPKYVRTIYDHLIDVADDGAFRINQRYFDYGRGLRMANERFYDLFGGPPRPMGGDVHPTIGAEAPVTRREMDVAASIQVVTEEVMLRLAQAAHKETGVKCLCMAGGVALNCVANGRLLREGPFERIWVQPAAGDAGGALGAALLAWHQMMDKPRTPSSPTPCPSLKGRELTQDSMRGSFLGPEFDDAQIQAYLESVDAGAGPWPERHGYADPTPFGAKEVSRKGVGADLRPPGYTCTRLDDEDLVDTVSELLAQGKVVGWFRGRMEYGPRALGARSILADPRNPEMQSVMNRKIKFRESFRPFAPSVLREHVAEWFDVDAGYDDPYMLFVTHVAQRHRVPVGYPTTLAGPWPERHGYADQTPFGAKEGGESACPQHLAKLRVRRSDIPAATHVDYSARVQTVDGERHGLYRRLIERFYERTGCPVLLNTSFNVRGEPIVCSPEDAYRCFMRTDIDALAMGNYLLVKSGELPGDCSSGRSAESNSLTTS